MAKKFRIKAKMDGKPVYLPGMEPKKDAAIQEKAEVYAKFRDARMNAGRQEIEAGADLIDELKKKKIVAYEYGDLKLELISKDKVKVKIGHDEPEPEPEEKEDGE